MTESNIKNDKAQCPLRSGAVLGDVWILEEGAYYSDRGIVVCAAKTKSAMLSWINSEYPNHRRKRAECRSGEIYFENDDERTWLRCEQGDKCPLVA